MRHLRGFTLIELLVVIAVLGVLSAGVLTAINITGNINKANLAKAKTFSASLENALAISQVGKWSFEETVSPSKDTSGYGNEGTWSGGVTSLSGNNCAIGKCLSFDGTLTAKVNLPDNIFSSLSQGTIEVWVFAPGVIWSIFSVNSNASPGPQIELEVENSHIHWAVKPNNRNWNPDATGLTTTISPNQWHHIVVTVSSLGWKLYLDGVLDGQGPETGFFASITDSQTNVIGNTFGTRYLNGRIDEFRVYREALTSLQIKNLFAQALPRHQLASMFR